MPKRVIGMTVLVIMTLAVLQSASGPVIAQETRPRPGGYIDATAVGNHFRFRFDAGFDNPVPDRAEFFYAQMGDPGPPNAESRVDYQEFEAYFERAFRPGLSAFAEVPIRILNPEANDNAAGLGDVRAGFKYALVQTPDEGVTFQLRAYFPSGDAPTGLGTNHYSLEPGILFQRDKNHCHGFGEFKAWIPIDPSQNDDGQNYSGTVLRYGFGQSYDLFPNDGCDTCGASSSDQLSLVTELVGWTILGGLKSDVAANQSSAAGDTIVNLKIGLRWTTPVDSLYVGYGTALTDDVWYQDLLRAQYECRF